jgi:GPH family glycoside/pentoside/hexuronide:cation symporter
MFETNTSPLSEMSFLEALKNTFVNRSFLAVTAAQTMRFVTTNGMAAGMSFFVKYALKLEASQTSLILATVFIISALMLYPWRQLIANRFEPRTTSLLAYLVVALGVSTLWFAVDLTSTLISSVVIGIGFAGIFLMDNILIADVVDEDETKTGARREGMFFGVNSLVTTLSTAVVSIAFGAITSAYGYDPALATQPDSAGRGFRVFMTLLPALGCASAFLILLTYPLHGARLREMKRQLVELRASKPNQPTSP